jgi:hypothetical protein
MHDEQCTPSLGCHVAIELAVTILASAWRWCVPVGKKNGKKELL